MTKVIELIKALSGLITAFFSGFGVLEFLLSVIVIGALFFAFAPEKAMAFGQWVIELLPFMKEGVTQ